MNPIRKLAVVIVALGSVSVAQADPIPIGAGATCIPGDFVACIEITSITWVLEDSDPERNYFSSTLEGFMSLSEDVSELVFTYALLLDGYEGSNVNCDPAGGPGNVSLPGPILCQFGLGREVEWSSGFFSMTYSTHIKLTTGVPIDQPNGTAMLGMEAINASGITIAGCDEGF